MSTEEALRISQPSRAVPGKSNPTSSFRFSDLTRKQISALSELLGMSPKKVMEKSLELMIERFGKTLSTHQVQTPRGMVKLSGWKQQRGLAYSLEWIDEKERFVASEEELQEGLTLLYRLFSAKPGGKKKRPGGKR
jgi:hypothetical protein